MKAEPTTYTDAAAAHDANYPVRIPIDEIYADIDWNSREKYNEPKLARLSQNIGIHGLQLPIVLRAVTDEPRDAQAREDGSKYVIVSGHRRYLAYSRLRGNPPIPATRVGNVDDFKARSMCAIENLQRTDLTFWEEAKAVEHFWHENIDPSTVANDIGVSRTWVLRRFEILEMPDVIQRAAAKGFITASNIDEVKKFVYGDQSKMLQMLKALKETKGHFDVDTYLRKHRPRKSVTKVRTKQEMFEMQELIRRVGVKVDENIILERDDILTKEGNGLATRALAWAAGMISDADLHATLEDFCVACNVEYHSPEWDKPALPDQMVL